MEVAVVDQFVVPEGAIEEFLRHAHYSADIVKTRPGFVAGHIFSRRAADGRTNVVTTAVWANPEALEAARTYVQSEFTRIGFDPPQIMQRLQVQMQRGIYERAAY